MAAGHKRISNLLEVSEVSAGLDEQLFALADEIGTLHTRIVRLEAFLSSAEDWTKVFDEYQEKEPLADGSLTELNAWILVYQSDERYWQIPEGNFPRLEDPASFYSTWLGGAQVIARVDLAESLAQQILLELKRDKILPDYHQALDDSLGLSVNLVLHPNTSSIEVGRVRDPGLMTLGGGILGLLVWFILSLIRIEYQREKNV